MNTLSDLRHVLAAEWRRVVYSARGAVLFALYGVFACFSTLLVGTVTRNARVQVDAAGGAAVGEAVQSRIIDFLYNGEPGTLEALQTLPTALLVTYRLMLAFLPLYITLLGFDQLSGELSSGSIRYLTPRTPRWVILLGKALAQLCILNALLLVTFGGLAAYAHFQDPAHAFGAGLVPMLRLLLGGFALTFAYAGLTTLCSVLAGTPTLSLFLNLFAWVVFVILDLVASNMLTPDRAFAHTLRFVTPAHYVATIGGVGTFFAQGALAFVAFAAVFFALANVALARRDV